MKTKNEIRRDFEALFKQVPPPASDPAMAPTITVGLENQTVTVGQNAIFALMARGTGPLHFQWRKNGENIPAPYGTGVSNGDGIVDGESEYQFQIIDLDNNGLIFDVVISNEFGSVTSNPATLKVKPASQTLDLADALPKMLMVPKAIRDEVKRTEARRKAGKFDPDKDYPQDIERLQPYQFHGKLSRATDSKYDVRGWGTGDKTSRKQKQPSHGVDADGLSNDKHFVVFNGLNSGSGMSVTSSPSDPNGQGPRQDTPEWILDHDLFQDFLRSRIAEGCTLKGKELYDAAGLDCKILIEHYFGRKSDKEIYEDHANDFKAEKAGFRHTSSTGAVKRRRLHLVRIGDTTHSHVEPAPTRNSYQETLVSIWQETSREDAK